MDVTGFRNCVVFAALLIAGCDRFEPEVKEEEVVAGETPRTFTATAGAVNAGGFEQMQGPASLEVHPTAGVLIRLSSTFAFEADTTTITILAGSVGPGAGTYPIANLGQDGPRPGVAIFYRSVLTDNRTAASESGELGVTSSGSDHIKGSFEAIVFIDEDTGPETTVRRRLRLEGRFHARRQESP